MNKSANQRRQLRCVDTTEAAGDDELVLAAVNSVLLGAGLRRDRARAPVAFVRLRPRRPRRRIGCALHRGGERAGGRLRSQSRSRCRAARSCSRRIVRWGAGFWWGGPAGAVARCSSNAVDVLLDDRDFGERATNDGESGWILRSAGVARRARRGLRRRRRQLPEAASARQSSMRQRSVSEMKLRSCTAERQRFRTDAPGLLRDDPLL